MILTESNLPSLQLGCMSTTCMILPVPTSSIKLSGVEEEKRYEPILTSNNHSTYLHLASCMHCVSVGFPKLLSLLLLQALVEDYHSTVMKYILIYL